MSTVWARRSLEVQPADITSAQGVQVIAFHLAVDHVESPRLQDIHQGHQGDFGGIGYRLNMDSPKNTRPMATP